MTLSRWIPKDSTPVQHPEGLGVAYCYASGSADKGPKPAAIGYGGARSKADWHNSFRTEAQRDQHIAEWFEGLEQHRVCMAARKAEHARPHDLVVGDIVVNSWGYDQTNIDFYVVTKATPHNVWIQPIASEVTETGFMCGNTVPELPPRPCKRCVSGEPDPPEQHHAEAGGYVHFKYGSGHKWSGHPERSSWYA